MPDGVNNPDQTWPRPARVSVVVDTPGWFDPFAARLVERLGNHGHVAAMWRDYDDVPHADIAFFLSCMRIAPPEVLERNRWNFVVHASDLPKGRGFSPIVWQVLEGSNEIPVTMIEMTDEVDAGDIVRQERLYLTGHELNPKIRERLGELIVRMCVDVVTASTPPERRPQVGEPTWYPRRRPKDSQLDPLLSLAEQFNLLRVVDNERYPAFFDHRGRRFRLLIEDSGPVPVTENDEG